MSFVALLKGSFSCKKRNWEEQGRRVAPFDAFNKKQSDFPIGTTGRTGATAGCLQWEKERSKLCVQILFGDLLHSSIHFSSWSKKFQNIQGQEQASRNVNKVTTELQVEVKQT